MMVKTIERPVRDRLGEGLMWSRAQNALFWTDILEHRLYRLAFESGAITSWQMPGMTGWVLETADGGLVAGIDRSIMRLTLEPFALTPFVDLEQDLPANRLNDAKIDPWGNIWAGTMPISCEGASGSFYRIGPDGDVRRMDSHYIIANGPAISPDGRHLYHTDTGLSTIYRFTLDASGVHDRQTFIQFEPDWGTPDGMTCDSAGGLWVAHWGGACVSRFSPDGKRDTVVPLPASQITNCIFAGPNLDRMFVTSAHDGLDDPLAGGLFEIETGYQGFEAGKFGC